jgi:hypothetical protein
LDKGYEKHTCFCYYHRYQLTIQNCEELDIAGYADSSTGEHSLNETEKVKPTAGIIPPPPKKLNQSDLQIHLLLRNSEKSATMTEEEFDISVDMNNDNENSHELNEILLENEENTFFASDQVYTPRNSAPMMSSTIGPQVTPPRNFTGSSISTVTSVCNPTPFADLIGWGRNTAFLFDPSQDKLRNTSSSSIPNSDQPSDESETEYISYHPMKIPIPPSINLERISMIACSHRHMIVLTHNGSLYSCGDNTEGALGLGDTFTRRKLTLVLWPIEKKKTENLTEAETSDETKTSTGTTNLLDRQLNKGNSFKRVVYVAAGSSDIGSHSMAIDVDGALYGWGTPSATGHGKIQPVLSPSIVKISLINDTVVEIPEVLQANEASLATEKVIKVKHVACGGGFTVAVLSTGQVASWGMWAHGRLGLGLPPQSQINRGAGARRRKDKKKVVRYQLKPKLIAGLGNVVKVSQSITSSFLSSVD